MPTTNRLLPGLVLALAVLLAACGGSDEKFSDNVDVSDQEYTPVIASSELAVGTNRFVLGFLGGDGTTIVDAKVHLKFYDLAGGQQTFKFETDAVSRVPARDAGLKEEVVHSHSDGSQHVHSNAGEDVGVYTANVTFDTAGVWGVEIALDSRTPKLKTDYAVRFDVLQMSSTPAIGSQAPASKNPTLADVRDITQIDSSLNPVPEFHQSSIASAIATKSPALVLFAVPGYCESRFCGPEYEIMKKLYPKYKGRMEFIQVEFYKKPGDPAREPADVIKEWNLRSEPWFFVIDANGRISAKFEGPTTMSELDEALQKVAR